ncbi:MAG: NADH-quinone oxidoreductase subunit NuoN [Alphaproteobacteria bacterium]|nr:NADH-quinone oxidoreductase subunit NuoN [Alphaproteobacteria bacterium SS10]
MPVLGLLTTALPELILAIAGMAFLMIGVFYKGNATTLLSGLAIGTFVVLALLIVFGSEGTAIALGGQFITDGFAVFMKVLVLAGSGLALLLSLTYLQREQMDRFEYPILVTFATLGMLIMVSANDLMSLYVGLELQSLSLYVLAAFRRDALKASEAGLKYFVLGALSSGILLYGASLVYGFSGTTNFTELAAFFASEEAPIGAVVGLVFVLAGLAFKISAVPFHMWTPDVYEGAPTPVTAFFALAPKIAAFGLLTRVLIGPFGDLTNEWQQVVIVLAVASLTLGAFAAIAQTNIKRLMAYSSIANMGYALVGLAAGSAAGASAVAAYLAIYLFMTAGAFAVIINLRVNDRAVENLSDLAGLAQAKPFMAACMAIFMFSMAGIPPLAGFFGKLVVFQAAVQAELYVLAIIGVLASVVGAFYYLRIIKIMYFDEATENFDRPLGGELSFVVGTMAVVTLFLFILPGVVFDNAGAAAATLFGG